MFLFFTLPGRVSEMFPFLLFGQVISEMFPFLLFRTGHFRNAPFLLFRTGHFRNAPVLLFRTGHFRNAPVFSLSGTLLTSCGKYFFLIALDLVKPCAIFRSAAAAAVLIPDLAKGQGLEFFLADHQFCELVGILKLFQAL